MSHLVDLKNKVFGRLLVLKKGETKRGRAYWICRCECGKQTSVLAYYLKTTHTQSCGCLKNLSHTLKHGFCKGQRNKPEYESWNKAKRRCFNKSDKAYLRYGGRGITMSEKWSKDFLEFYKDMGQKPNGSSLDRINNNGNYEPGNCRWATPKEQSRNRRNVFSKNDLENIRVLISKNFRVKDIAEIFNKSESAIYRIKNGKTFSLEDVMERIP